jgi:linoleoyl-CoA desaturase
MNKSFSSLPLKYSSSDTDLNIYAQIRANADTYFKGQKNGKLANNEFWLKTFLYCLITGYVYFALFVVQSPWIYAMYYIIFGFALLLLGINVGHDAAHRAVTGNLNTDNRLFRCIFNSQGLSGYLWQIRHNYSHHNFPNVEEHDSDLEMGNLILLDRSKPRKWYHDYQYIYAPILYFFASIALVIYQDYEMMERKDHGNLRINSIPFREWAKFILSKLFYLVIFLGLPLYFSHQSPAYVILVFFIMHFCISIFMMFTFVISHHVEEVDKINLSETNLTVDDAWIRHQIITTIDFNESCKISNFIFGGFNLHVAHHIFPEVNHIHYPSLTKMIKETLSQNGYADWYKSYSFMDGCKSHIRHLKSF